MKDRWAIVTLISVLVTAVVLGIWTIWWNPREPLAELPEALVDKLELEQAEQTLLRKLWDKSPENQEALIQAKPAGLSLSFTQKLLGATEALWQAQELRIVDKLARLSQLLVKELAAKDLQARAALYEGWTAVFWLEGDRATRSFDLAQALFEQTPVNKPGIVDTMNGRG